MRGRTDQEMREKFTGKEFDTEGSENGGSGIGLFYFGARYYDADVGRWVSTDPAREFRDSYRYTINPITWLDPTGLETVKFAIYYNVDMLGRPVDWSNNEHLQRLKTRFAENYPDDELIIEQFGEGHENILNMGCFLDGDVNLIFAHSAPDVPYIVPYTFSAEGDVNRYYYEDLNNHVGGKTGIIACFASIYLGQEKNSSKVSNLEAPFDGVTDLDDAETYIIDRLREND